MSEDYWFRPLPPPPPYYWPPTSGRTPENVLPSIEELERYEAVIKTYRERVIAEHEKKDKEKKDKDGKKSGVTAREAFWMMMFLSLPIAWVTSGALVFFMNGLHNNLQHLVK